MTAPPAKSAGLQWRWTMRNRSLLRYIADYWLPGLLVVALLTVSTCVRAYASQDSHETYCADPAEMQLLTLINDFRAGRGLEPLGLSQPLGAAATAKSEEMARQGYFAHTSPQGVTPRQLVTAHGYEHNTEVGENIAAGQESAEAAFAQWRDSPSHRELMLDEDFAAIGIARAYNVESRYDWYWTAEFGGVLADPAEPCTGAAGTPVATPSSTAATPAPVHLRCEGTRRADGTYDLTCRDA